MTIYDQHDLHQIVIRLAALRVQLREGALDPDGDVAFLLREYDCRVAELLEANNREVERRRSAEQSASG